MLLGQAWTIDIDVNNAYSNAHGEYSRNSIGSVFNRYALLLDSKCETLMGAHHLLPVTPICLYLLYP
jgi:hypothetical protein